MRKLELVQPCDFTPDYGVPTGEPHVLQCVGCGHSVRDLSAHTEDEALAFLDGRRPGECVRFRVDEEGRMVFANGQGSLFGRIAKDARPLLAVATLALAACDHPEEVRPEPKAATASLAAAPEPSSPATSRQAPPEPSGVGAPRAPTAAVPASARSEPLTPALAAAHAKHSRDKVVGKTKDGRVLFELSGY